MKKKAKEEVFMKYEELFKHYYTMVYRLSLLLLKNKQDAEDAAMTIFLRVMEVNPDFADDDHTRAWLITVTRNYCKDIKRSSWHKCRTDFEELPEQPVEPFVEQFDKQESLLFEIFQSLPKKQREVVYLYYFEDYSVKEISQLLSRNESTVQSQLFAARKRMKKQFSTAKAAALILSLIIFTGFGTLAADAASGGKVLTAIREFFSIELTEEEKKLATETLALPVEIYASELAAIDENFLVLANERGLLIYSREYEAIISAIDLQEIECNYFNSQTLVTRIFQDSEKLYLFNDHVESTDNENFYGKQNITVSMPDFAYCIDLSAFYDDVYKDLNQESISEISVDFTLDISAQLSKITDRAQIEEIYGLWNAHTTDFKNTFEEFRGADFLDKDNRTYDESSYSRKSLLWSDSSGIKMLSCLVTDKDNNYKLYTKLPNKSFMSEPLNLMLITEDASQASDSEKTNEIMQTKKEREKNPLPQYKEPKLLPEFIYSGDDPVIETLCAYMKETEADCFISASTENSVYIPSPLILDTVEEGEDLIVFCNLWSFYFYRNGNMLVCESGKEAPARLKLHPNKEKTGGYEIVEDLRTGEGDEYAEGIKEFCEGYPGVEKKYSSDEYNHKDVELEMISMYVRDNLLSVKYYKDFGWDPVPLNLD